MRYWLKMLEKLSDADTIYFSRLCGKLLFRHKTIVMDQCDGDY